MKEKIGNFINKIKNLNFKDKRILMITVVSILALLTLISTSLAMFLKSNETDQKDLFATGDLTVVFDDATGNAINLNPAKPVTDEYGSSLDPYTFTITNNGTYNATYNVTLVDSDSLTTNAINKLKPVLKFKINDNSPEYLKNTSNQLLVSGILEPGETIKYSLRMWVAHEATTEIENLTYSGTIAVSGKATNSVKLARKIINSNTIQTSLTNNGLFVQEGDSTKTINGNPTYYFRGAVTNNYVSFGTYTSSGTYNYNDSNGMEQSFTYTAGEPIIWRIVRINEDGSIRLVTEKPVSSNIAWNPQGTVNYVNSDTSNGESDTIKDIVEDWYDVNIGNDISLDSVVIYSNFCNDISGDYSAASSRTLIENAIFTCPAGAVIINEKVGLLTSDEIIYSGSSHASGGNSYLNGSSTWSMTPYNSSMIFGFRGVDVDKGSLYETSINYNAWPARAVINLSPNVLYGDGDGLSAITAYTIK